MTNTTASAHYLGVDVSSPTLRAALVQADGQVLARREAALDRNALGAQVAHIVSELRDAHATIAALGVGVPGLVNPETGRTVVSTDLPTVVRGDLRAELAQAIGLPITIENDANAAAYGEYIAGAGRGSRNVFYITIGTGIGGALILDGRLWRGTSGFAGEIGHITIDPEGILCTCGNVGCLETVASAPNIGTAVATVINLLNVERIVLGGTIMDAGDLLLQPIIREAGKRSFQPCFEATQIVAAQLAADGVSIGAAMLARDATRN